MAADQQKPQEKSVKSRSPAAKPGGTRPARKATAEVAHPDAAIAPPGASAKRAGPAKSKPTPKRPPAAGKARAAKPLAAYSADEVRTIFERFRAVAPEPKGELDHVNPFTLLVAVVLSAQATDVGVNKATRELFRLADTPAKMVALGEDRVRDLIKTIGLFRNKAKNTILLSQALIDRFGGEVPADRDALVSLPGVGRKTANVVLNGAFGQPTLAVDTHILRLGNRLRLAPGKTPDEVEAALLKVIPDEFLRHAHHWLILHGRYVCKARKPDCAQCVIADLCRSDDKTSAVPLPLAIARAGYPRGSEPAPEA